MMNDFPGDPQAIETAVKEGVETESVQVRDVSHLHAGHTGGSGHFELIIKSSALKTLSPVERHKKVYEIVGMGRNPHIHALKITII